MVKARRRSSRSFGIAILGGAIFLLASATPAAAYTGVEYESSSPWAAGTVVAVDSKGGLVAASVNSSDYVGVVAKASTGSSVEVADSGVVSVLVSDQNGTVESGSRIGLSSVSGVASAWTGGTVVAVLQETPTQWKEASLEGSGSVKLATVKAQLLTDGASTGDSPVSVFFAALDKTAAGVAGKPVDTWRIITALLIGVGGLILAFGLLFISSRESFFSMGRNPMASKMIMRGLWKMVALSVGILCVTLTAAYLIVRVG